MKMIKVECCKFCPYFSFNKNMIKEWDGYYSCCKVGKLGDGHCDFNFDEQIHPKCVLLDPNDALPPEIIYPRVVVPILVYHPEQDNKILVLKRKDNRSKRWELPEGLLRYLEIPESCAMRAFRETTGIYGNNPHVIDNKNIFLEDDKHYYSVWIRLDVIGNYNPVLMKPDKYEKIEWIDIDSLVLLNEREEVCVRLCNAIMKGKI